MKHLIFLLIFLLSATAKIIKAQTSTEKFRIVLDAGHGGRDSVTRAGNILEKNLVLEVAKEIKTQLRENGFEVIMTREIDVYVSLPERAAVKGDAFISIHANAVADTIGPSVRTMIKGMEIYISPNATAKSNLLSKTFERKLLELDGIDVRGIKKKTLAVLSDNPSPAIMLELGFLSNLGDLAFLSNKENYKLIATAFVGAIKEYKELLRK